MAESANGFERFPPCGPAGGTLGRMGGPFRKNSRVSEYYQSSIQISKIATGRCKGHMDQRGPGLVGIQREATKGPQEGGPWDPEAAGFCGVWGVGQSHN